MNGESGDQSILKRGYWDETRVVTLDDGSCRVRKSSRKGGPWALAALKKEIRYLRSLPPGVAVQFPEVLTHWGLEEAADSAGYEMPFFLEWKDAGSLVRGGEWCRDERKRFLDELGDLVVDRLQEPAAGPALSLHVRSTVREACEALAREDDFRELIEAATIRINDRSFPGLRRSLELIEKAGAFAWLDEQSTRLHGDLILENVLWNPQPPDGAPALILIDPVSVAGIDVGHPAFDLVKHESYASGELFAIREERVVIEETGSSSWNYRICWDNPEVARFRSMGLCEGFRLRWERRHGPVSAGVYQLIDGYFSLAMAMNTTGLHQQARVLKALQCLGSVLAE